MNSRINPNNFDYVGKCHLSIGRVINSSGDDYILLSIQDELSGCSILEAECSLEDFALILTGMGKTIDFGIRSLGKIGKKLETKYERIQLNFDASDNEIREAVREFEVDGWCGKDECCKNHHNRVGDDGYRVLYVRWVERRV
jgi:hypothetical protein